VRRPGRLRSGWLLWVGPGRPGTASEWLTYTVHLDATPGYSLTLYDAAVSVDGSEAYTGTFVLLITGTSLITGAGHTAAP